MCACVCRAAAWSGTSDADLCRYEHLEDTNNNTFRALRVFDPAAPAGQRNLKVRDAAGAGGLLVLLLLPLLMLTTLS